MASIIKNLIEYTGLANTEEFPLAPEHFKQLIIQENLVLVDSKPDIGQIIRIMTDICITGSRIIKTPIATSLEGQILTGKKIIVEGELVQHIEYAADEPNKSVHAAHFNIPFSTFIVFPDTVSMEGFVNVIPYIEDISVQRIDKRALLMNMILFLEAIVQIK